MRGLRRVDVCCRMTQSLYKKGSLCCAKWKVEWLHNSCNIPRHLVLKYDQTEASLVLSQFRGQIKKKITALTKLLNKIVFSSNQEAQCVSASVVTQWHKHTACDDEVKCGALVIEQPRQQDSAVKETRVRRSKVGDGEGGRGQQREPTDSRISWSPPSICLCDTLRDTVLEQKDSSPVGLPVGHLTSSSVDQGVVAAKQRRLSSSPAQFVSTLEHCLHTTWQHHPPPNHTHHCLRGARRHTSCNDQTDPFLLMARCYSSTHFFVLFCTRVDLIPTGLGWRSREVGIAGCSSQYLGLVTHSGILQPWMPFKQW